jgi:hypothetical protein
MTVNHPVDGSPGEFSREALSNVSGTASSSPEFLTLLQVARAFRGESDPKTHTALGFPPAEAVVRALLCAEQTTKRQHTEFPLSALLGEWQLCFSAPRRARPGAIAPGRYFPKFIPAQISFQQPPEAPTHTARIGNQVQLGNLQLKFTGPARYLGKKNLLAFDFLHVQLTWNRHCLLQRDIRGGSAKAETFQQQAIAHQPFFAFFLASETLIAARGRGGGLALWVRPRPIKLENSP